MKKITLTLLALFSVSFGLKAQEPCLTMQKYNELKAANPQIAIEEEKLEQFTREFAANKGAIDENQTIIIPVVFHQIYASSSQKLPESTFQSQVSILTNDWNKTNSDFNQTISAFKGIAADFNVEFKLAKKDPNGNPTTGIDYILDAAAATGASDADKLNPWPRSMYLNVWVVNSIDDGGQTGGQVLGYAYFPSGVVSSPDKDGVMMIRGAVGGRTLTHEAGHWANLHHPWGPTQLGNASNCDWDDGVDDTPNCIGTFVCNTAHTSCGSLDNIQNFMGYASCTRMFTEGQKVRVRATLFYGASDRPKLWTPENLVATGLNCPSASPCAPKADFIADGLKICEGGSINFEDFTFEGVPTSWEWTFQGGTPASSTNEKPTVQYNAAGTYDVTLKSTNSVSSSTKTRQALIKVVSTTAQYSGATYSEGFENSSIPNNDWEIINEGGGKEWVSTNTASSSGNNCVMIDNYNNVEGEKEVLISPSIDMTAITGDPRVYFKAAYAQKDAANNDVLNVYYSLDCGLSWTKRKGVGGSALKTADPSTSVYVPSASEWKEHSVVLTTAAKQHNNVFLKFEFITGGGNNIYLDDILVSDPAGIGMEEIENLIRFEIFPNPMNNAAALTFELSQKEFIRIDIIDMLGKKVAELSNQSYTAGQHRLSIENMTQGIYFVKMNIGDRLLTKKIIVN